MSKKVGGHPPKPRQKPASKPVKKGTTKPKK